MWKISKDGGLDFDVQADKKQIVLHHTVTGQNINGQNIQKRYDEIKHKMFGKHEDTANTITFWDGIYPEIPKPHLTAREKIQRFRAKKHKEYNNR